MQRWAARKLFARTLRRIVTTGYFAPSLLTSSTVKQSVFRAIAQMSLAAMVLFHFALPKVMAQATLSDVQNFSDTGTRQGWRRVPLQSGELGGILISPQVSDPVISDPWANANMSKFRERVTPLETFRKQFQSNQRSAISPAGREAANIFLNQVQRAFTLDTNTNTIQLKANGRVLGDYYRVLPRLLNRPDMTDREVEALILERFQPLTGLRIRSWDGIPLYNDVRRFMVIDTNDMCASKDVPMFPSRSLNLGGLFNLPAHCSMSVSNSTSAISSYCPTDKQADTIKQLEHATSLITHRANINDFDETQPATLDLERDPGRPCHGISPSHCSGFLDPDRLHVWTATHCLRKFGGLLGIDPPAVGETVACPSAAPFRAVFGLRDRITASDPVDRKGIFRCSSVTRTSEDVVRIRLALPDGTKVSTEIVPHTVTSTAFDAAVSPDLAVGTYTIGFSFPRSTVLAMQKKGEIRNINQCHRTIEKSRNKTDFLPDRAGVDPADYYACISNDTLSGSSGGPIYAATKDGNVIAIGVTARAHDINIATECVEPASGNGNRLNLAAWLQPRSP